MATVPFSNPSTQHLNPSNGLRTCAIFLFIHEELCPWHCIILEGHGLNSWRPKQQPVETRYVKFLVWTWGLKRVASSNLFENHLPANQWAKKERKVFTTRIELLFVEDFNSKYSKKCWEQPPERSGYCAGPEWHTLGAVMHLLPALWCDYCTGNASRDDTNALSQRTASQK